MLQFYSYTYVTVKIKIGLQQRSEITQLGSVHRNSVLQNERFITFVTGKHLVA